jgi:hypothetical protein
MDRTRTLVGDVVIIVNCGDSVASVCSFEIKSTAPQVQLDEVVASSGERCGSEYVDREFHRWMKQTFGTAFEDVEPYKKHPHSKFMKEFNSAKRDYGRLDDDSQGQEYEVSLLLRAKDSEYYEADEGIVKFPS